MLQCGFPPPHSQSDVAVVVLAVVEVAIVVVVAAVLVLLAVVAVVAKMILLPLVLWWLKWLLKAFLSRCLSSTFLYFDLARFKTFLFFFCWVASSASFCRILTLWGMRSKMARFETFFVGFSIALFSPAFSWVSWWTMQVSWVFPGAGWVAVPWREARSRRKTRALLHLDNGEVTAVQTAFGSWVSEI